MSRKNRSINSGLSDALANLAVQLTGEVTPLKQVAASASNSRWFFLQHSAPSAEMYAAYLQMAETPWLPVFGKFWPDLAIRHRAIQLASTVRGKEFTRWLAFADLTQPLGAEVAAFFQPESWFAPLDGSSTYVDLAVRYVAHTTKIGNPQNAKENLNAHVVHRDLDCCIPIADGLIADAAVAEARFPVTPEVVAHLQVWANMSLLRGHEAFDSPSVLDTIDGHVEALRTLTHEMATASKLASLMANPSDRLSVMRGRTLERRARLSQSAFFVQATKQGLDYDRSR